MARNREDSVAAAAAADGYDPEQSIAERREIQRGMRDLIVQTNENQDDFLEANPKMFSTILDKSKMLMDKTKQTSEAAIDARLILQVSELSYKRSLRWTSGNAGNGIDVDELVSKCVTYMRHGSGIGDDNAPELSSTQRHRRVASSRGVVGDDDEDEVGDEGDMLNWEHLGRFACVPYVQRPALPGFLLGPLSVEKRARKVGQRTARLRVTSLQEVRPQILKAEDLAKSDKNDLPALCSKILRRLETVQLELQEQYERQTEHMDASEANQFAYKSGLREDGGVDLLRFVVNPHSFGQTVENMFYVSFLIRDGKVGLEFDANDMPSLYPASQTQSETGASRRGAMKHQAILPMDMSKWREIIAVYDIKEPMIEHRKEQHHSGPGARGWYS